MKKLYGLTIVSAFPGIFWLKLVPKESSLRPEPDGSFLFSVLLFCQKLVISNWFSTWSPVGVSALMKIRCFSFWRAKSD